jgi:serine O-acetyltransferase
MSSDGIWHQIQDEAEYVLQGEPRLRSFLERTIRFKPSLEDGVSAYLSRKLGEASSCFPADLFLEAFHHDACLGGSVAKDLLAVDERDPACHSLLTVLLYMKGFHAITTHRLAHYLWEHARRKDLALYLQSLVSEIYSVDIHPAAKIGAGVMLDHATGFVAGETSVIEDDVSILHGVTLGGTGKEEGDRHPKVRRGVLIGAGAKILGNVEIGESAKIGAGSVVLKDVPPHVSVAGVPAKVVGKTNDLPSLRMNHNL